MTLTCHDSMNNVYHMLNLLPQRLVVGVAAQVSVGKWSKYRFIAHPCNEVHHFRLQTGPTHSKFP
jgi:hypothetical protein